jgi:S1-C subfamily serine protease
MRTCILCWFTLCGLAAQVARSDDTLQVATLNSLKDATVFIKVEKDKDGVTGSGFLVRVDGETGYIVTNHHVVKLAKITRHITFPSIPRSVRGRPQPFPAPTVRIEETPIQNPTVTVVFSSGTRSERSVPGEVVASDSKIDLAVIKVGPVKDLPRPIELSRQAELGETLPVFALGFPLGQLLAIGKGGPAITVTKGTITSIRRNERDEVAVVQIDSDLNPGNSGGPVVDSQGRLVGIAVAKVIDTRLGMAIPTRELSAMIAGKVGEVRLAMSGPREVSVAVDMIDPLERVRSVVLRWVPAAAAKGTADARSLAELKESREIALKRDGNKSTGTFPIEVAEGAELTLAYQVIWTGSDGKTHVGERQSFVAKGPKMAPPATKVAGSPSAPAGGSKDRKTDKASESAPSAMLPNGKPLTDAQLTRAIEELLDPAKAQRAAELLARSKPDAARRAEVTKALQAVASEQSMNAFARVHSIRALGFWGSEQDVDFLIPLTSDGNLLLRREAIDALSWLGGKKAAEAIADRVFDVHDHARAIKGLERMGSVAEDAVVATLLGNAAGTVRMEGCNLLKTIGTEHTLQFIEDLARDDASDAVRLAAAAAAKAIKERQQSSAK